jgi:hypothetical protein
MAKDAANGDISLTWREWKTRQKDNKLERLISIARRITTKQMESLSGAQKRLRFTIDLKNTCQDVRPSEPVSDSYCKPNIVITDKNKTISEGTIPAVRKTVSLDNKSERTFTMYVARSYPKWNQIRVGVLTNKTKEEKAADPDGGVNCNPAAWSKPDNGSAQTSGEKCYKVEFWLGYFDFPLTDNTFLSNKERYAVILDKIDRKEEENGRFGGEAQISLIYFPASLAGLKEKSFYQQRMMSTLLEDENALGLKQ